AEHVRSSGTVIADIMSSVHDLSQRITDISVACNQQANGVNEVTSAISELDGITQSNTQVADSNAASAATLLNQSDQLARLTKFFEVPQGVAQRSDAA
ncbi:MAG: hypothetical protein AAGF22_10930, partial [Pseudomonadota bacterium]